MTTMEQVIISIMILTISKLPKSLHLTKQYHGINMIQPQESKLLH